MSAAFDLHMPPASPRSLLFKRVWSDADQMQLDTLLSVDDKSVFTAYRDYIKSPVQLALDGKPVHYFSPKKKKTDLEKILHRAEPFFLRNKIKRTTGISIKKYMQPMDFNSAIVSMREIITSRNHSFLDYYLMTGDDEQKGREYGHRNIRREGQNTLLKKWWTAETKAANAIDNLITRFLRLAFCAGHAVKKNHDTFFVNTQVIMTLANKDGFGDAITRDNLTRFATKIGIYEQVHSLFGYTSNNKLRYLYMRKDNIKDLFILRNAVMSGSDNKINDFYFDDEDKKEYMHTLKTYQNSIDNKNYKKVLERKNKNCCTKAIPSHTKKKDGTVVETGNTGNVTINYTHTQNGYNTHLEGMMHCKSLLCLSCYNYKMQKDGKKIQQIIQQQAIAGRDYCMATLTVPGKADLPPSYIVDLLYATLKEMYNDDKYKALKREYGIQEGIRKLEITVSQGNGVHPHFHILYFFESYKIKSAARDKNLPEVITLVRQKEREILVKKNYYITGEYLDEEKEVAIAHKSLKLLKETKEEMIGENAIQGLPASPNTLDFPKNRAKIENKLLTLWNNALIRVIEDNNFFSNDTISKHGKHGVRITKGVDNYLQKNGNNPLGFGFALSNPKSQKSLELHEFAEIAYFAMFSGKDETDPLVRYYLDLAHSLSGKRVLYFNKFFMNETVEDAVTGEKSKIIRKLEGEKKDRGESLIYISSDDFEFKNDGVPTRKNKSDWEILLDSRKLFNLQNIVNLYTRKPNAEHLYCVKDILDGIGVTAYLTPLPDCHSIKKTSDDGETKYDYAEAHIRQQEAVKLTLSKMDADFLLLRRLNEDLPLTSISTIHSITADSIEALWHSRGMLICWPDEDAST